MLPRKLVEVILFKLVNGLAEFQLAVLSKCPANYEPIERNGDGYLSDVDGYPPSIAPICYPTSRDFSNNKFVHDNTWKATAGIIGILHG